MYSVKCYVHCAAGEVYSEKSEGSLSRFSVLTPFKVVAPRVAEGGC
jgi:hypothetical protein